MITRVLNTSFVPQAHTSENICAFLKEVANEWNIDEKIVAIVTDNASNMKLAVTLGGWKHVSCFAHTLNLAVTDALKNNSELNGILARCRSLQEVPTRWNSTVGDPIAAVLASLKRTDLLLEEAIQLIKGAVTILEPFEEATKDLSSQSYASLSKVIPVVALL
uniref:DUF659 domain-containing protein n=1 Tax=Daphnia galeata TaxID=27404 RepID=A0A8J2WQW0_9CRUS|nr:unnamed protein product [Daphnia galeata]